MAAQASTCRHFYTRPNGWRGWRAAPSATPPPASTRSWPPAAASTYGTYPDIVGLIQEQASEMDGKKREANLHRIQQLIHEKAMVVPIWELAFINGHGPRVAESGLTLITNHAYSAPYEDVKLRGK